MPFVTAVAFRRCHSHHIFLLTQNYSDKAFL